MSAAQHTAQAASAPATPAPRRITLAHVELAIHTARTCRRDVHLAGFAAMTGYPAFFHSCPGPTKRRPHHGHNTPAFIPMDTGLIAELIKRTCRTHGRDEVRRTWGLGIRELQAQDLSRPA
ncbi:hypothetical protein JI742_09955 [Piscinibacter sp. Jin2]|uniref:Uncharacterized protein n=1 Tax=Aquariibacter lacus TaxID=2801332 RepID=A0A9X1BS31_9BURK|nr:hypothetical protein [Piscinibacter lacus]MBL0720213.1 hypothetical protein [Piscinibacter lacus]